LNKSPSENLAGDGEGLVAVSAFLRVRFALGAAAGDATGEGDAAVSVVPASAFLRPRLAFGEEAGDAAVSAGEAVV
jgi:hypothetical protein